MLSNQYCDRIRLTAGIRGWWQHHPRFFWRLAEVIIIIFKLAFHFTKLSDKRTSHNSSVNFQRWYYPPFTPCLQYYVSLLLYFYWSPWQPLFRPFLSGKNKELRSQLLMLPRINEGFPKRTLTVILVMSSLVQMRPPTFKNTMRRRFQLLPSMERQNILLKILFFIIKMRCWP